MAGYRAELKDWFEGKLVSEFGFRGVYYLEIFCQIKETEKAAYIMFFTGYRGGKATRKCAWIPKSAIENIENIDIIPDYEQAVQKLESKCAMYV